MVVFSQQSEHQVARAMVLCHLGQMVPSVSVGEAKFRLQRVVMFLPLSLHRCRGHTGLSATDGQRITNALIPDDGASPRCRWIIGRCISSPPRSSVPHCSLSTARSDGDGFRLRRGEASLGIGVRGDLDVDNDLHGFAALNSNTMYFFGRDQRTGLDTNGEDNS